MGTSHSATLLLLALTGTPARLLRTCRKQPSSNKLLSPMKPHNLELFVSADLIRSLLSHDIQVILLQEAKVLPGFRELALLHTLSDVPVHERALPVHHIVLLVDALSEHA